MSDRQSEIQTNETAVDIQAGDRPSEKKRNTKIIIITSLLIVLIAAGGTAAYALTKNTRYDALVKSYNKDFETIQTASAAFKNQIETPPSDKKTLQAIVTFYRELKSKSNFDTQVTDLNNNPRYASLNTEKKQYSALGMEKTTTEFNDILKDIDKLQSIMQRSENLDSEIKILETTASTINEFNKKTGELITRNNTLKDELLGVVVSVKLKDAQSTLVEALTYRGKYLVETQSANDADLAYKIATDQYDRNVAAMNDYKRQSETSSYYASGAYTNLAYAEADKADKQRQTMDEKKAQQNSHKTEAANMLAKYLELMGLTTQATAKTAADPAALSEQAPKQSVGEEKVKLFVEDYVKKGIEALHWNDYSIVESYIDKTGKKYQEQRDYMDYLKKKGISEDLLSVQAKSVEAVNDSTFNVTTLEQYDIFYADGSRKLKSFNSKYKVVKSANGGFLINDLLETKEIESKDK